MAQSVALLTEESEVAGSITVGHITSWNHGIFSMVIFPPLYDSRRAVVSYWRKYTHLVLINWFCIGVGKFRTFFLEGGGGARFRILGGGGGDKV